MFDVIFLIIIIKFKFLFVICNMEKFLKCVWCNKCFGLIIFIYLVLKWIIFYYIVCVVDLLFLSNRLMNKL